MQSILHIELPGISLFRLSGFRELKNANFPFPGLHLKYLTPPSSPFLPLSPTSFFSYELKIRKQVVILPS